MNRKLSLHESSGAAEEMKAMLHKKSGFEIRLIGAIMRLSDTSNPVEALNIDEIKAAIRALFPHLRLTNTVLNGYIAEATRPVSASLAGKLRELKDRELAEECDHLNGKQRLNLAKKLVKWADELRQSVGVAIQSGKSRPLILASNPLMQARALAWSPAKRRKKAKLLIAWAAQLNATADFMDGKPVLNLN